MGWVRVFIGLPLAMLFLIVFALPRWLAQMHGSRRWRWTPIAFQRLLCWILRLEVRVIGGAPAARGPRLLVANHISWLDIPALGSVESVAFLAKKEVGRSIVGKVCAALQGVVYVDRERRRPLPATNAAIAKTIKGGESIVIFAEGTTADGNKLLRFRTSHFEAARIAGADAVVQPIYIDYRRLAGLPIGRSERPIVAWYGDMAFYPHLTRLLRSGGVCCEISYGNPIRAADFPDWKSLARATEAAVRAAFG